MLTDIASIAGVSLGPFADYNSRLFSGSAAELFEFANQNSEVSKRYESSLRVALKYGVRVSFIGSIDDQLVSLEVGEPQLWLFCYLVLILSSLLSSHR